MQNLVRIGIADAAEEPRIGERTFQRVVLAHQCIAEGLKGRIQNLESSAVKRSQCTFALSQVKGCTLFRSGFGQEQSSGRKIECGKAEPCRDGRAAFFPLELPRDHKVDHEEQVTFEFEHDLFAEPAPCAYDAPVERRKRERYGAQYEWTCQSNAVERFAHNP